jgi:hypothetical protein
MRNPSVLLEDILDDCITAIQKRGKTVADCLARYPAQCEELEPLLRLTVRLQAARTLHAPPEFRRVAAMLLVGGGTVYASTDALPGDALYPVKRAVEAVQLAMSLNDASDAMLHLAFAARRLDEAAALLEKDRPQDIGQALTGYEAQVESVLVFFGEDSDLSLDEQTALADLLVTAQAHHEARLTVLLDQVPEAARPTIELALMASRTARAQALETLGGEPGKPEDVPTDLPEPSPQPPTKVPEPTSTPAQPPTLTPSPEAPAPTLSPQWPTPPEWVTPPAWPTGWPTPPAWVTPSAWPTEWPTPPAWVTPSAWPTEWPTPPAPPKWPGP